jgi:hypothetical protein
MAPINRLPTELVSWICTHLEPCDLFALRLASGDIAAKGFHHFAKRFFTSLHLLVTSDNLALLKDIADHPLLRVCVREVWITPALFEGEYDLSIEDYSRGPGSNVAHIRDARYAAYQAAVADHLNIAMTPVLQRALDDAFERFPNLKSVGLRHHFTDYLLRGEHRPLKCRGWKALQEAAGRDPALPWFPIRALEPGNPPVRARVWSALLMALATA